MDWKTMLAYISGSVDEELLLWNEYLVAENRILRNQTGAIELNANDADVLTDVGLCLSYAGRAEEGLESARKAMRLNPHCPEWYLMQLGQIYYDAHRYEEAVATFESLHSLETTNILLYLTASHTALGHAGEAQKALRRVLDLDPQATLQKWANVKMAPYSDPKDLEHFRGNLGKAGLPD